MFVIYMELGRSISELAFPFVVHAKFTYFCVSVSIENVGFYLFSTVPNDVVCTSPFPLSQSIIFYLLMLWKNQ